MDYSKNTVYFHYVLQFFAFIALFFCAVVAVVVPTTWTFVQFSLWFFVSIVLPYVLQIPDRTKNNHPVLVTLKSLISLFLGPFAIVWMAGIFAQLHAALSAGNPTDYEIMKYYGELSFTTCLVLLGSLLAGLRLQKKKFNDLEIKVPLIASSVMFFVSAVSLHFSMSSMFLSTIDGLAGALAHNLFVPVTILCGPVGFVGGMVFLLVAVINYVEKSLIE